MTLADEVDVSRGDVLAARRCAAGRRRSVRGHDRLDARAADAQGRSYLLKIGTQTVTATVAPLKYKVNVNTLEHVAAKKLELNDIGVCGIELGQPIVFEPYAENRDLGGFILIDRITNTTVGAGLLHFALRRSQNVHWQALDVDKAARAELKGQKPCVVWFTGLSGAGKSTIANLLEKRLHALGRHTYLLDGDNVRHGLNKDLGFTDADRVENIRRVAEVARLMVDAGLIVLVSFISPFRAERRMARELVRRGRVLRGVRRHAARGRRDARPEGSVQEGPARRAEELHGRRFAVRGARAPGSPGRHHATDAGAGSRHDSGAASAGRYRRSMILGLSDRPPPPYHSVRRPVFARRADRARQGRRDLRSRRHRSRHDGRRA